MIPGMEMKPTRPESAIRRLVEHHGGVTRTASLIADGFHYQLVQQWVDRGWASPMHFLRLEKLLLSGMTVRDLYADRDRNGRRRNGLGLEQEAQRAA
jgi:hypothetical protein